MFGITGPPPAKSKERVMFLGGIVKGWNAAAASGQVKYESKQCPRCGGLPGEFQWCELRTKTFLGVLGGSVYAFEAMTLRFQCPLCMARFTMQPPWGLPRKRYVRGVILSRCWRYLRKAGVTYRSLVSGTGYASRTGERISDKYTSHTRVWYWLKDLGGMMDGLRLAKRLILAKNPSTKVVGQVVKVAYRKYRSEQRHGVLQSAYALLQLRPEWYRLFRAAFPPKIGTPGA
jgi:hypothetical protein